MRVRVDTSLCEVTDAASGVTDCRAAAVMVPEEETRLCAANQQACVRANARQGEQEERRKHPPTKLEGSCETSLDCQPGRQCLLEPGEETGVCVEDLCSRSLCRAGTLCSAYRFAPAQGETPAEPHGIACLPLGEETASITGKPIDRCSFHQLTCALSAGRWVCKGATSANATNPNRPEPPDRTHACGRALVVEGRSHHAVAIGARAPETSILVARFTRMAFDEHASIAAFGRTCLALLALGAPAWLIEETCTAMRDEVEHAKLAFELLDALCGAENAISAGVLPEAVAPMREPDLARALLEDVLRGGCVGESMAVLEAASLLPRAPSQAHAFLERIILDEARHAALAWKTARWLVSAFPTLRFEAPSLWQDAASDVPAALRGELFEPVARAVGLSA